MAKIHAATAALAIAVVQAVSMTTRRIQCTSINTLASGIAA